MKYCTFYIVRHGETDWNALKLVQGHTDILLNKKGENQAKSLGQKLNKIRFDAIFSSDLLRAKRTAEIIAIEREIKVKATEKLRERYFGRLEGKSWKDENGELKYLWKKLINLTEEERRIHKLERVENNHDLIKRLVPFLNETAVIYGGKNVLVVTHGGLMRVFLLHVGFGTDENLPSGSIDNLAYIKVDYDGADFIIKETFGIKKITPQKSQVRSSNGERKT